MDDKTLIIYNELSGPNFLFLKYLKNILQLHTCILESNNPVENIKKLLRDEFNAELQIDSDSKIIFETKESKILFIMKYN
jgi:hypothetical protein